MELNIKDKIKIILSLDEKILLPASTIDRNYIFYQLYDNFKYFFKELEFEYKGQGLFESDELDQIIFHLHYNNCIEAIYWDNKYYKVPQSSRNQIIQRYKDEIQENQQIFNKIAETYLYFLNEKYPNLVNM